MFHFYSVKFEHHQTICLFQIHTLLSIYGIKCCFVVLTGCENFQGQSSFASLVATSSDFEIFQPLCQSTDPLTRVAAVRNDSEQSAFKMLLVQPKNFLHRNDSIFEAPISSHFFSMASVPDQSCVQMGIKTNFEATVVPYWCWHG